MFSEKKESPNSSERNTIGKSTIFKGNITSEGDFRIDGKLEGNIETLGRIIIGQSGSVKGEIQSSNVDIEGVIIGKVVAKNLLTLKSTATIEGEVEISKLSVEPGARFNATCNMKHAGGGVNSRTNEQFKKDKTESK